MKKFVALIIALALMFSVCSIAVSALTVDGVYIDLSHLRLSLDLLRKLKFVAEDDLIAVNIDFDIYTAENAARNEAGKIAKEETGISDDAQTSKEAETYERAYNRILDQLLRDLYLGLMDQTGLTFDDVLQPEENEYNEDTIAALGMPHYYNLSKTKILDLATTQEGITIDLKNRADAAPLVPEDKIDLSVQEALESLSDDDTIQVGILVEDPDCDWSYLNSLPYSEAEDLFYQWDLSVINDLGIPLEDVTFDDVYITWLWVEISKATVYSAVELDMVRYIDFSNYRLPDEPTEPPAETEDRYRDKLIAYIIECNKDMEDDLYTYEELYDHQNQDGDTDWALIHAVYLYTFEPYCEIIGNRLIYKDGWGTPIDSDYAVYDAVQDTFVVVDHTTVANYDGLEEVFNRLGGGKLIGDINNDNELDAVDVTLMQRCTLNIRDYPEWDEVITDPYEYEYITPTLTYYSDFNRDGERDVVDVTLLQRYILGIPVTLADGTVLAE